MIENYGAVTQDQLIPSSLSGCVRVLYPRGAQPQTVLSIDTNGVASVNPIKDDGSYEAAKVLSNGNLLYLADRVDSVPTIVLGADLKAL